MDGQDRLTETDATVGIRPTRSTAPAVSTRASGVPSGIEAACDDRRLLPGVAETVTVTTGSPAPS